jgi:hypothetical protein
MRFKSKKLREKLFHVRSSFYFNAWANMLHAERDLLRRLRDFETKINHQWIKESFSAIQAFSKTKKESFINQKQRTSKSLQESLNGLI